MNPWFPFEPFNWLMEKNVIEVCQVERNHLALPGQHPLSLQNASNSIWLSSRIANGWNQLFAQLVSTLSCSTRQTLDSDIYQDLLNYLLFQRLERIFCHSMKKKKKWKMDLCYLPAVASFQFTCSILVILFKSRTKTIFNEWLNLT